MAGEVRLIAGNYGGEADTYAELDVDPPVLDQADDRPSPHSRPPMSARPTRRRRRRRVRGGVGVAGKGKSRPGGGRARVSGRAQEGRRRGGRPDRRPSRRVLHARPRGHRPHARSAAASSPRRGVRAPPRRGRRLESKLPYAGVIEYGWAARNIQPARMVRDDGRGERARDHRRVRAGHRRDRLACGVRGGGMSDYPERPPGRPRTTPISAG